MAGTISMGARREVVSAVAERYRAAGVKEKGRVLDELCALTNWHRKHAIRALAQTGIPKRLARRGRRKQYGAAIRKALTILWDASDRVCGKRLKVMIPALLPALELHGRLALSVGDRKALLTASPATIDRLLCDVKIEAAGGRRRRAGSSSAIRREVPVRTFNDWKDPAPGFCEVDMVAHSGASAKGSFIQTLTMVDVATGWTECVPLLFREGVLVIEAVKRAQSLFPWLILGADFDNDSANETVVRWCEGQGITVTRSRAYKKNDQAYVEQKNGAVVRRLTGYGRFEGLDAARILARLYAASRLHVNFFQPSFKLKEKRREGAKIIKRYHPPATPYERALSHPALDESLKRRLQDIYTNLDPVLLLEDIRVAQAELGAFVDRPKSAGTDRQDATGTISAPMLGQGLDLGERRSIHRRPYVRRKPVPKRASKIDPYRAQIDLWLLAEPHLTAVDLLSRLQTRAPETFDEKQLRTVQRAVKAWRCQAAQDLIGRAELAIKIDPDRFVPAGTNLSGLPSPHTVESNIVR
jgi:hypothetical protein